MPRRAASVARATPVRSFDNPHGCKADGKRARSERERVSSATAFVPPEAVHRLLDALDPLVRRQLDALGFRPSRPAGKLALGH